MDAGEIVHEMRLFKSPEEVKILRRAASIACQAHLEAMKRARPGAREYQIEALLEYVFRSHGSIGPAYPSIVASGPNATILHYQANQSWLREGDLILVDAGAEYGYYASDVTRTYPVSGRFSAVQRDLYALVLKAQREAIALVLPGQAWDAPHKQALHVLTEGLVRLGVLKGEVDALVAEGAFRPFYMHRTSHWLGMDVHDVGNYRIGDHARILEPGMVLTVEPGLYFSPEASGIDPVYRGIGIRIEDDILVTSEGHEILSVDAPREIEELERVVGAT
jgi:Xaa-Pro aminopeptidase